MFGLSGEKLLILGLIAVFILGPDRLPHYAQQLARFAKSAKRMADGAKDQAVLKTVKIGFEICVSKRLQPFSSPV